MEDTADETERLKVLNDLCQEDIVQMTQELNSLREQSAKLTEECEEMAKQLGYRGTDVEIRQKIRELEEENKEILRDYENSSFSLEKALSSDSDKKLLNEAFVVLQKKLSSLESINSKMQQKLKKSELDTKNLKKKCESASIRCKNNEDLKEKIKNLEIVAEKYSFIESSLKNEIKEAEERLKLEKARPENQVELKTAQRLVNEVLETLKEEKIKFANLENLLKEKKNYLQEMRTYGTQSNKITVKLRNELKLVQVVYQDKQECLKKIDEEIEEYERKYRTLKEEYEA